MRERKVEKSEIIYKLHSLLTTITLPSVSYVTPFLNHPPPPPNQPTNQPKFYIENCECGDVYLFNFKTALWVVKLNRI